MKLKKIHHIGYLVKEVDKSSSIFEKIGYERCGGGYDPVQKANILFLRLDGVSIELVVPDKDSDVYPLLKKFKDVPYHICYIVDDMSDAINEMIADGFMLFKPPVDAIAINAISVFMVK